jgi:hypothetical protein
MSLLFAVLDSTLATLSRHYQYVATTGTVFIPLLVSSVASSIDSFSLRCALLFDRRD